MKKNISFYVIILFVVLGVFSVSGCGATNVPEQTSSKRAEAVNTVHILNQAEKIEMKKDITFGNDSWQIFVDNVKVAEIKGLSFPTLGDQYSLMSPSGGIICSEDEKIFNLVSTANFYDSDKRQVGVMQAEFFTMLSKYNMRDMNNNLVASLEYNFSINDSGFIKDSTGSNAWNFNKKLMSFTSDIVLTRVNNKVDASTAILMMAIADKINETQNNKNNSNNRNH